MESLKKLTQLSSLLACDLQNIQAAGGNISLKNSETLWIKASGKWLANAWKENIFVDLNLQQARESFLQDQSISASSNRTGLRPSIETSMHAMLDAKVIIHTHALPVLSHAIRFNAEDYFKKSLQEFNWYWVPYAKPGIQLTQQIIKHASLDAEVLILQNHGLIVTGDDCDEAYARYQKVINSIASNFRLPVAPNMEKLQQLSEKYNLLMPAPVIHSLAVDPISYQFFSSGILYPDQAVMLGAEPFICDELGLDQALPYYVIPDVGILLPQNASKTLLEMLEFQAWLLLSLQKTDNVFYLSQEVVNDLLEWDAEKYRQKMIREN